MTSIRSVLQYSSNKWCPYIPCLFETCSIVKRVFFLHVACFSLGNHSRYLHWCLWWLAAVIVVWIRVSAILSCSNVNGKLKVVVSNTYHRVCNQSRYQSRLLQSNGLSVSQCWLLCCCHSLRNVPQGSYSSASGRRVRKKGKGGAAQPKPDFFFLCTILLAVSPMCNVLHYNQLIVLANQIQVQ